MSLSRRRFLASLGAAGAALGAPALIGLARKSPRRVAGAFVEDGAAVGHRIRDHAASLASGKREEIRLPAVIVGGGVAGLSAAWELERRGMRDFVVLELERQAGGNARSGENEVSAYPWAAHYVPVPDRRETLVRELFEELGVFVNGAWEERYLCFAPQERLFMHGEWQPGIEPDFALDQRGRDEFRRFDELVQQHRATGQFTIPMELGVRRDSPLDQRSMAAWLREMGFRSPQFLWYIDYACRDDYGALARDTSAWAGVHYFASRAHDEQGPLTWPEGNGWIVKRLMAKLGRYVRTDAPVVRIERASAGATAPWRVRTPNQDYLAEAVIFAAPSFLASYLIEGMDGQRSSFVYSPWMTANLTLERWPAERGASRTPVAWDNVIYDSPSLGYVVATHQSLRAFQARDERTVWTYYWSLAELSPRDGRELLLRTDWGTWRERILADLERAHPDIRDCVSRIDIMRHGHAMIRPTVGFLSAPERLVRRPAGERLWFANSDRGGLSLFEEAQYNGVTAAREALGVLG